MQMRMLMREHVLNMQNRCVLDTTSLHVYCTSSIAAAHFTCLLVSLYVSTYEHGCNHSPIPMNGVSDEILDMFGMWQTIGDNSTEIVAPWFVNQVQAILTMMISSIKLDEPSCASNYFLNEWSWKPYENNKMCFDNATFCVNALLKNASTMRGTGPWMRASTLPITQPPNPIQVKTKKIIVKPICSIKTISGCINVIGPVEAGLETVLRTLLHQHGSLTLALFDNIYVNEIASTIESGSNIILHRCANTKQAALICSNIRANIWFMKQYIATYEYITTKSSYALNCSSLLLWCVDKSPYFHVMLHLMFVALRTNHKYEQVYAENKLLSVDSLMRLCCIIGNTIPVEKLALVVRDYIDSICDNTINTSVIDRLMRRTKYSDTFSYTIEACRNNHAGYAELLQCINKGVSRMVHFIIFFVILNCN